MTKVPVFSAEESASEVQISINLPERQAIETIRISRLIFSLFLLNTRHSGRQGAPLPRLCFAQLALPLSQLPQKATIFAMKSVTYTQTYEHTNGHPQLFIFIEYMLKL